MSTEWMDALLQFVRKHSTYFSREDEGNDPDVFWGVKFIEDQWVQLAYIYAPYLSARAADDLSSFAREYGLEYTVSSWNGFVRVGLRKRRG